MDRQTWAGSTVLPSFFIGRSASICLHSHFITNKHFHLQPINNLCRISVTEFQGQESLASSACFWCTVSSDGNRDEEPEQGDMALVTTHCDLWQLPGKYGSKAELSWVAYLGFCCFCFSFHSALVKCCTTSATRRTCNSKGSGIPFSLFSVLYTLTHMNSLNALIRETRRLLMRLGSLLQCKLCFTLRLDIHFASMKITTKVFDEW